MKQASDPKQYIHFLEEAPVIYSPLIYLTTFQDLYPFRAFVDDEHRANALLLEWQEPGEPRGYYLFAESAGYAKIAVEWLMMNEPESNWFLDAEVKYHNIADGLFEPEEEGYSRYYKLEREGFRPYKKHTGRIHMMLRP